MKKYINIKNSVYLILLFSFFTTEMGKAQPWLVPKDKVSYYTKDWQGERDQYGRPVVSENMLERMKYVTMEEAWGTLSSAGYNNQLEVAWKGEDWKILHPKQVMVGRALTVAFLPDRPDVEKRMIATGKQAGGIWAGGGDPDEWAIQMLSKGDVIVVDHYGKLKHAAFAGSNLAADIYGHSGKGLISYGQARDRAGIRKIKGFNAWVKSWHPTSSGGTMMLKSINDIIRIGGTVVAPGDVVLATENGVIFIPPHLAQRVILSSEVTRLRDQFGIEAMAKERYTSQQIHAEWKGPIKNAFFSWIENNRTRSHEELGVGYNVIDKMIETQSLDWEKWLEE